MTDRGSKQAAPSEGRYSMCGFVLAVFLNLAPAASALCETRYPPANASRCGANA